MDRNRYCRAKYYHFSFLNVSTCKEAPSMNTRFAKTNSVVLSPLKTRTKIELENYIKLRNYQRDIIKDHSLPATGTADP